MCVVLVTVLIGGQNRKIDRKKERERQVRAGWLGWLLLGSVSGRYRQCCCVLWRVDQSICVVHQSDEAKIC